MQGMRPPVIAASQLPTVSPESLTEDELEEASEELGMRCISLKKIRAHKVLGAHLQAIGVTNVARGMYMFNLETIQSTMQVIAQLVDDNSHEAAVQAKFLAVQAQLARAVNEAAKGLIESGEIEKEKAMPGAGLGQVSRPSVTVVTNGPATITSRE